MDRGSEIAQPQPEVKTSEESVPLTPEQRELLRSLERSMMQAARGEGRPAKEFMQEWQAQSVDREPTNN